ncbi:MAG: hypothetical protein U0Z75_05920 [Deinococcaceae bacterium]
MKKYIVIGLLLMVGKGMATTGIPLDTEICKPGMGVEVEKGNASVGIKERGSYCNVEVGGDSVDIFGLKSDYCIEGPLDDGCEESPGVEKPSGTGKSDTSKTGKMPDGLKWYEVPGALGGGRYSRRSDSCVYRSNFFSSTPSSSVFSSLSACSGSPAGRSVKGSAYSPKLDNPLNNGLSNDLFIAVIDALPALQSNFSKGVIPLTYQSFAEGTYVVIENIIKDKNPKLSVIIKVHLKESSFRRDEIGTFFPSSLVIKTEYNGKTHIEEVVHVMQFFSNLTSTYHTVHANNRYPLASSKVRFIINYTDAAIGYIHKQRGLGK